MEIYGGFSDGLSTVYNKAVKWQTFLTNIIDRMSYKCERM